MFLTLVFGAEGTKLSFKAHIVLAGPDADPCVESGDVHMSTMYETR